TGGNLQTGQITYTGNAIMKSTGGSIQVDGVDTSTGGGDVIMNSGTTINVAVNGINTGTSLQGKPSGTVELIAPTGAITLTSAGNAIATSGSNGAGSGDVYIVGSSFNTAQDIVTSNNSANGAAGNIYIATSGN